MRRGLFLLFVVSLSGVAISQPLPIRNHRAFSLPFLRIAPITDLLAPGRSEWAIQWSQSNDASLQIDGFDSLEEDGEFTRINVSKRWADHCGTEWMVEVPLTAFSGGALDAVIDGFHGFLLGGNDPLRDSAPMYRAIVRQNGREFDDAIGVAGVTVSASRKLGSIRATAAIKVPTSKGDDLLDSGRIDIGVAGGWSRDLGKRFGLDLHAGIVRQGRSVAFEGTRTWVNHQTATLRYQLNSRDEWSLQFQSESSALRTGVPTSDAVHRLGALGYRRSLGHGRALTAFIAEDFDPLVSLNPSKKHIGPDVTIGVGITIRK